MNKERSEFFFNVLLVEDNAADILLLKEALAEIGMNFHLHVVHDGEEAMCYLHKIPPFTEASRPDLILLDLNLPKKNGFAVLTDIKQDEDLLQIPVVVLSTSKAEEDINRSYRLQANCYIIKPPELDQFMDTIRSLGEFWLQKVKLPKQGPEQDCGLRTEKSGVGMNEE